MILRVKRKKISTLSAILLGLSCALVGGCRQYTNNSWVREKRETIIRELGVEKEKKVHYNLNIYSKQKRIDIFVKERLEQNRYKLTQEVKRTTFKQTQLNVGSRANIGEFFGVKQTPRETGLKIRYLSHKTHFLKSLMRYVGNPHFFREFPENIETGKNYNQVLCLKDLPRLRQEMLFIHHKRKSIGHPGYKITNNPLFFSGYFFWEFSKDLFRMLQIISIKIKKDFPGLFEFLFGYIPFIHIFIQEIP